MALVLSRRALNQVHCIVILECLVPGRQLLSPLVQVLYSSTIVCELRYRLYHCALAEVYWQQPKSLSLLPDSLNVESKIRYGITAMDMCPSNVPGELGDGLAMYAKLREPCSLFLTGVCISRNMFSRKVVEKPKNMNQIFQY